MCPDDGREIAGRESATGLRRFGCRSGEGRTWCRAREGSRESAGVEGVHEPGPRIVLAVGALRFLVPEEVRVEVGPVLADLGVQQLRLLTNNQPKIAGLTGFGLKVVERVPLTTAALAHHHGQKDEG